MNVSHERIIKSSVDLYIVINLHKHLIGNNLFVSVNISYDIDMVMKSYTPPSRDLYCSPCRLYGPTYRSSPHIPLEEVMWKAEEEVYSDNLLRRRRLSE